MRKISVLVCGFLLATLTSISMIGPAQGTITSITWIGAAYIGSGDPFFYPSYIVAYETGSDWSLAVEINSYVENPYWDYKVVNVSRIHVWFDWGTNYTTTYEYPLPQIPEGASRVFTVTDTTPPTTTASNLMMHSFKVYVEHAKNTTTRELGGETFVYSGGKYFVVYSADQADAMELFTEINAKFTAASFSSYEAQNLLDEAEIEDDLGDDAFDRGDFAAAKTYYETALSLLDSAFAAETAYSESRDDYYLAQINYYNAAMVEANASMKQADAAMTEADAIMNQSYAWIMFGAGFLIFSIAGLVYAIKKPKEAYAIKK